LNSSRQKDGFVDDFRHWPYSLSFHRVLRHPYKSSRHRPERWLKVASQRALPTSICLSLPDRLGSREGTRGRPTTAADLRHRTRPRDQRSGGCRNSVALGTVLCQLPNHPGCGTLGLWTHKPCSTHCQQVRRLSTGAAHAARGHLARGGP
jgi:hypothetical protein